MKELAKQYDPSQVEDRIYQFWLDGGYFHTKADPDKKPYTIVMPSERHRPAPHGPRRGQHHAGHPHPHQADAGLCRPVGAWHGPRFHRYGGQGRGGHAC